MINHAAKEIARCLCLTCGHRSAVQIRGYGTRAPRCPRAPCGGNLDAENSAPGYDRGRLLSTGLSMTLAAEPGGLWLTEGGKATIRIASCAGAVRHHHGTQGAQRPGDRRPKSNKNNPDASKRGRSMIGVQIVLGMKPTVPTNGAAKSTMRRRQDLFGSLTLQSANALRLEGCVLRVLCKSRLDARELRPRSIRADGASRRNRLWRGRAVQASPHTVSG